jgi:hypothetical protein
VCAAFGLEDINMKFLQQVEGESSNGISSGGGKETSVHQLINSIGSTIAATETDGCCVYAIGVDDGELGIDTTSRARTRVAVMIQMKGMG